MIVNVIIPVMIVMVVGYLFGRYTQVDHTVISKFSMVVLSPALIFSFLVRNSLTSNEMLQIVLSVLVFTILMIMLTVLILRMTGYNNLMNPALLSTVFPNTGNFGLPVLFFAYGEEAFTLGVVIVVINFILMYTLGVYFASLEGSSWKKSLSDIAKLPTTYATILAIIVNIFEIPIPNFLYNPIKMVGDAMVPIVLLILGMQLSRTTFKDYIGGTIISSVLKIAVAPVVIIAIVQIAGIDGLMAKVLIIQNSMPTAVVMTMIAAQYNTRTEMVANVTLVTTILSFFSITSLLYMLNMMYG